MDPIITLKDLMETKFPAQTWVVDRLIPASAITIVSGAPSSYKTWTLLKVALSVAKGESLFGQFPTEKTGVLIVDEEDGHSLLQQRLRSLNADKNLPVSFTPHKGFMLDDENVKRVLRSCKTYRVKLLIIDSLRRIHGSDENKSGDMAEVFRRLGKFTDAGIAVLITQHNRKPGAAFGGYGNEMRGSSDILAAADCHIGVKRDGNSVTLNQTKNRYAEELDPFKLLVVNDSKEFVFEYQGQSREDGNRVLKEAILSLFGEIVRMPQKDMLPKLAANGFKTNEHKLKELLAELELEDKKLGWTPGRGKSKIWHKIRLASNG